MKKIIAMLVLAAALVYGPVAVSGQTVRDAMGTNKGRIERSGTVRDSQGRYLGRMDSDGTVRDGCGPLLGQALGLQPAQRRAVVLL